VTRTITKLEEIEKKNRQNLEDQLFIGLIISLALLFVTFPSLADFSLFFQKYLNAPLESADSWALALKIFFVIGFFFSALSRYYGAIQNSEKWRYWSIEALFFIISYLIAGILIGGIGAGLIEVRANELFMLILTVLVVATYLVGLLERKILQFYLEMGQIKSGDLLPLVHIVFMSIALWFLILSIGLYLLDLIIITPIPNQILLITQILCLVVAIIPTGIIIYYYSAKLKRSWLKSTHALTSSRNKNRF